MGTVQTLRHKPADRECACLPNTVSADGRCAQVEDPAATPSPTEVPGEQITAPTRSIVDTSDGQRAIENMLRRYYEPMEEWYLRSSIEKVRKLRCHHRSGSDGLHNRPISLTLPT